MNLDRSDMLRMSHVHVPHIHVLHMHAFHMHPAHWLQNHTMLAALFVAAAIALLFIWITARIDINSVPSYLRRIHDGAWYLFRY